jgi:hypothetical protein
MITLLDWTLEPKGIDPLGEVKNASLTVSGFVHHATITYDENLWRDTFRINIANWTAELHQDTDLEKFHTTDPSGNVSSWSARRSGKRTLLKQEWDGGTIVLAICLFRDPSRVTAFLILATSPSDPTKLERIGSAEFLHSENRWGQGDASDEWMSEIVNPRHLQTIMIV